VEQSLSDEKGVEVLANLDARGDLTGSSPAGLRRIANKIERAELVEIANQILAPIATPKHGSSDIGHKS
jgi:hypothetical protein